jgi:bifunctional DNA-binding transcriptional regulator/antitoxin component of YhaV-PrlF toxin-antitoxin module
MKKMQRTVNLNGWVEIPVELRRALKIRGGTQVRFKRIKNGIAIYPCIGDVVDRYCGILAGLGLPPDIEREPDRDIG